MTERRIEMGQIVAMHGIKGEVKINAFCNADAFADYAPFYDADGHVLKVHVKRVCKNQIIASVDGVTDRDTAEKLRGKKLFASHDALPKLNKNEYYVCDLIGLDAFEDGVKIGSVTDVLNYGASDILQIDCTDGEVLLAMSPSTILNVDLINKKIDVMVPQMVEISENED